MVCRVADIAGWIEGLAPLYLAEEWDNVGLQIGHPTDSVQRLMTALSPSPAVVDQAVNAGVDLLVTHHPLIFRPVGTLRSDRPVGALLAKLMKAGIALYCAHTNLDAAPEGLGKWVGEILGIRGGRPLVRRYGEKLQKLVVYVPADHLEAVRSAICDAGAGHIGNYSHCTFSTAGTGTFLPCTGSNPYIGTPGRLESVSEVRLETVVPAAICSRVLTAMLAAHPYEEVAYDLYDLALPSRLGYGWVGALAEPCSPSAFFARLRRQLPVHELRIAGPLPAEVRRVAVVNGSGAGFVQEAAEAHADVFVTGDLRYHDAENAAAMGVCTVDAGHFATEALVAARLAQCLREQIGGHGIDCQVMIAQESDYLGELPL